MIGRELLIPLVLSLSIHVTLIPASSLFRRSLPMPIVPVRLVETTRLQELEKPETVEPEPKKEKVTAPRLLSRAQTFARQTTSLPKETKTERREPEKPDKKKAKSSDLRNTPEEVRENVSGKSAQSQEQPTTDGTLLYGDVNVAMPGAQGKAASGGVRGDEAASTGELSGSGNAGSTIARPVDGYQVKPQYPESARRARAEGTTVLKFRVLTTGKVGEIQIEKSAGRRDLDEAAAEAVKKWLFEPARIGKEPIAVWVTLPVEFKLN
jgi:protein TonB